MSALGCSRLWLAEAVEDGRVGEAERLAFEQHALGCAACHQAVVELGRLRDLVAQLPEPQPVSDFDRRRQRASLVDRAGARLFGPSPRRLRPALALTGAFAIALAGGAWALKLGGHGSERAANEPRAAAAPRYEVTSLQDGAWSKEESGGSTRVTLKTGSAEFHVRPLTRDQRFLVALPDGEIEVVGTRFVVAIKRNRTQFVVVTEGKVWLRQYGQPQRLLVPGTRWDGTIGETATAEVPTATTPAGAPAPASLRPAVVASSAAASAPATPFPARKTPSLAVAVGSVPRTVSSRAEREPASAPLPTTHAPVGDAANQRASTSTVARASRTPNETTSPSRPTAVAPSPVGEVPGSLFARGISAFRAGRYVDADALWRSFLAEQPSDARAEDAAFLRAVARSRLGDTAGAVSLAREYLRRFPRGLRRQEAASLGAQAP